MYKKGLLIVISAPSGTGKDALIECLSEKSPDIFKSISATTREMREGEREGFDYYFTDRENFEKLIAEEEVVEYTTYCNNYYGSPKLPIMENLEKGRDVVLKIEVEGAMNIRRMFPDSVLIFVLPPSVEELRNRLIKRGTEDLSTIEKRMKRTRTEVTYANEYDYIVVNDDLAIATEQLLDIIKTEKLKTFRNYDTIKMVMVE